MRFPALPSLAQPFRLICLVLLLLSLALLRFSGWVDGPTASRLIISVGYSLVIALLIVFAWLGVRAFCVSEGYLCKPLQFDSNILRVALRRHSLGLSLIALLSILLHIHEPTQWRTQNDEFAILSTSQMAHHERTLAIPSRFYYFENKPFFIGAQSDIRLPLFSVVTSLLHDFTGYRPSNTFLLNQILTPLFFLLLYLLGTICFHSRFLGILALLLAFSIPLFAQVSNSGGYDLLNITLILLAFILATIHLRRPLPELQSLLIYLGLLLAHTRYESLLYLAPIPIVIAITWQKMGTCKVRWIDVLSPLFLILPVAYNIFYTQLDSFREINFRDRGHIPFFSFHYIPDHLIRALDYFFTEPTTRTTSILLASVGTLAFIYLATFTFLNLKRITEWSSELLILLLVSTTTIGTFFIFVLGNYWGDLTDYQAVRFALPIFLIFIPATLWFLQHNRLHYPPFRPALIGGTLLYILFFSLPSQVRHETTREMLSSHTRQFIVDYAVQHGSKETLFISDSALGIIAHGIPSAPLDFANEFPEKIAAGFFANHYQSIFTFQLMVADSVSGEFIASDDYGTLDSSIFQQEPVFEINHSAPIRFQISQITALKQGDEWVQLERIEALKTPNTTSEALRIRLFDALR